MVKKQAAGLITLAGVALGVAFGLRRTRGDTDAGLRASDEQFHGAYDRLRTQAASAAPVLVLFGDVLVLWDGDLRSDFAVTPPSSQILKAVAHTPVGVFATAQQESAETLSGQTLQQLSTLYSAQLRARSELADLDASARADVERVLALSQAFVERLLARERCTADELARFATELGPWLLRLTEHATRLDLAALHSAVERALSQLTAARRDQLEVVVAGVHQARARSLGLQYFQKRFGEAPGQERRVTYAESASDASEARVLVGTRRLDRQIARAFFGDATRLQRDVLGDAAKSLLDATDFPTLAHGTPEQS